MKNLTFRQLRVFEAVARHLSFSRAAEELFLTQPAVSMQVKQLEESVGLPLVEQTGKRIRLTEAGTLMAQTARRLAGRTAPGRRRPGCPQGTGKRQPDGGRGIDGDLFRAPPGGPLRRQPSGD